MAASQSSSFGGRCEGRLRHVAAALGRAPAPVAAADGGSSVFRVLFVGVDHPHGCAWRKSLQEAGRFEIVGLVPGFGGAITSLEEEYIALPRYADADAALAAGLAFDGAVVLLSNREAPPNCVSLASAGKHVVLEKPGVGTVEDAQAILDAADASGAVFTMAYTQRFAPCAVRLAEMAADKQFGKVISLENVSATTDVRLRNPSHYLFDPEENKYPAGEGGYFSWLGCHNLDMVRFVSGQKIVGVTARVGVYGETDSDVEDGGAIIIELADGALVTLIGGYWVPQRMGETTWCVRGTQRWVHWEGLELKIKGTNPQWEDLAVDDTWTAPADTSEGYGQGSIDLLCEWAEVAMGEKVGGCTVPADAMLKVAQLLDAVYESSREGTRVAVDI